MIPALIILNLILMGIIIKKQYRGLGKSQFHQIMNELQMLRQEVNINNHKIETLMSTFEEVSAKLDAQAVVIGEVKTSLDGVEGDVANLKDQIANLPVGGVITQEQLDSLSAKADAVSQGLSDLKTKAAGIDDETPPKA